MGINIDRMERLTVEEFQEDFDNLMNRVEDGESFIISSEYGEAMIVPYKEYEGLNDDLIRIHTDHDDGC